MARLKDFTVRRLRELARKHLGPGHSKLKTKEQLIAALKKIVPALRDAPAAVARKRASGKQAKATAAKRAARPPRAEPAREASRREPAPPAAEGRPRTPPAEIIRFEKPAAPEPVHEELERAQLRASGMAGEVRPRIAAVEEPPAARLGPSAGAAMGGAASRTFGDGGPPVRAVAAEPLVEGFFVARVAGTQEARRHHLTEDQVPAPAEHGVGLHYHEQLPSIPAEYHDDRVVLMARDPRSAFLYWDFQPDTRRAAFDGLREARAVLRVLETGHLVRSIDLALESRSFYVQGLQPGGRYRMELHAVGGDGTSRRIGPASNDVVLPHDDVSPDATVRMMRVPWEIPLNRLRDSLRAGEISIHPPLEPLEPLEIMHSRWVPMANSGSWQLQTWIERIPREGAAPVNPAVWPPSSWVLPSSRAASPGGASWALPPDRGER